MCLCVCVIEIKYIQNPDTFHMRFYFYFPQQAEFYLHTFAYEKIYYVFPFE